MTDLHSRFVAVAEKLGLHVEHNEDEFGVVLVVHDHGLTFTVTDFGLDYNNGNAVFLVLDAIEKLGCSWTLWVVLKAGKSDSYQCSVMFAGQDRSFVGNATTKTVAVISAAVELGESLSSVERTL